MLKVSFKIFQNKRTRLRFIKESPLKRLNIFIATDRKKGVDFCQLLTFFTSLHIAHNWNNSKLPDWYFV